MGSYNIMNDAKISVKPVDMADVKADRGGKGKERGIGERRAFSPSHSPDPFFVTATQGMDSRPLNKRKQRTRNG